MPAVWDAASPEAVLAARLRAVDAHAAAAARRGGCRLRRRWPRPPSSRCAPPRRAPGTARPLYAAHADLPVPERRTSRYWHAATLLREHRGDGHLAALLAAGLDPVEALVSHTATGKGMAPQWVLATRGWTAGRLGRRAGPAARARTAGRRGRADRGGRGLRAGVEDATDRLDLAPYEHLGAEGWSGSPSWRRGLR